MKATLIIERDGKDVTVELEGTYSLGAAASLTYEGDPEEIEIDSCTLEDGTEIELTPEEEEKAAEAMREAATSDYTIDDYREDHDDR